MGLEKHFQRRRCEIPITEQEKWQEWVVANDDDGYGKACVDVARRAMEILDEESGEFDCHDLISRADKESGAGGITGFMAGAAASMISQCHSRGEEFRKMWNLAHQVKDEGERANDEGGILNPALLVINDPE